MHKPSLIITKDVLPPGSTMLTKPDCHLVPTTTKQSDLWHHPQTKLYQNHRNPDTTMPLTNRRIWHRWITAIQAMCPTTCHMDELL